MTQCYDAVVAGHICLDIIPNLAAMAGCEFQSLFLPGRLVEVGPVAFCTGGAVSNTGLALSKLGIETRLMGMLGDDLFGRAVLEIVRGHGAHLADGMVIDQSVNTSYTIIVNPAGVDRTFLHCPGANDVFSAQDIRYDIVSQARLFHFGYPPLIKRMFENGGAQLLEIFRRVKEQGVTTSLDLAVFDPTSAAGQADWAAILHAVMPYVDIFVPNVEETLFMLRRAQYEELMGASGGPDFLPLITPALLSDLSRQLLDMGAKITGLKLGERGFYVRTASAPALRAMGAAAPSNPSAWAEREVWAPCFRVRVAGTTGAGDATVAGFLSALLRDLSLDQAATFAVAVGACNVEAADALSGLRSWEETWQRVESGWERCDLALDDPFWCFDECHQTWAKRA